MLGKEFEIRSTKWEKSQTNANDRNRGEREKGRKGEREEGKKGKRRTQWHAAGESLLALPAAEVSVPEFWLTNLFRFSRIGISDFLFGCGRRPRWEETRSAPSPACESAGAGYFEEQLA